jgi:hypothetical protein
MTDKHDLLKEIETLKGQLAIADTYRNMLHEEIEKQVAARKELLDALKKSVAIIKEFKMARRAYYDNDPEMKAIREAICKHEI